MIFQILFVLIALITLVSAVFVVTARRTMHAALWLVLCLFGVAILFALLDAGFFAVVQVLVYIGAIAILIIFAVMLTRRVMDDDVAQVRKGWWAALLAAVLFFAALAASLSTWPGFGAGPGAPPDRAILVQLGSDLVDPGKFAIPFEVASVLLLAALIGAIYVAADKPIRSEEGNKGGKG